MISHEDMPETRFIPQEFRRVEPHVNRLTTTNKVQVMALLHGNLSK